MGVERHPFMAALAMALVAMLFAIISISTQGWTMTSQVSIGLWEITDDGETYNWVDKWAYSQDFFYEAWMNATRGLMMSAIIIGGFAIIYNAYILQTRADDMVAGKFLLIYYMLTGICLIVSAAVYCSLIPQKVYSNGIVVDYIYKGNYGYSVWMAWIAGGLYLPAGALSFEACNQANKERMKEQMLLSNPDKNSKAVL